VGITLESPRPVEAAARSGRATGKEARRMAGILTFGLMVLTVLACVPYAPQGPFDARTYARLAGMRLEQHSWTALIEPLFAPLKIIAGAPDFWIATVSVLAWTVLVAFVLGLLAARRTGSGRRGTAAVFRALRNALVTIATVALRIMFFAIARVPGWRLVVRNPNRIIADLHSHTVLSHDGLASLRTNVLWHQSSGYTMEAVTEHDHLSDHEITWASPAALAAMPALMSGVEDHTGRQAVCVGLCPNTAMRIGGAVRHTASFAQAIHAAGGAVFVVTLRNLTPNDITRLAADGVDGFEIANEGHPGLPPRLARRVLAVSRARGLVLLADSDYHGWTGLARTWNVIRAPGAATLSRSQRVRVVLRQLRRHDSAAFTPVVAGYMGAPSMARAIFSPFVEFARYAMELSLARVLSWWVWAWGAFGAYVLLDRRRLRAGSIMLASLVWATGAGLVGAGIALIRQGPGTTNYGFHVGLATTMLGAVACLLATLRGLSLLAEYRRDDRIWRSASEVTLAGASVAAAPVVEAVP
jgi:hypothetical protein